MSAKYKSPSFLLPNEINTNTNPLNTDGNPATGTGINSLYSMDFSGTDYISAPNTFLNSASVCTLSFWMKGTGEVGGGAPWNGLQIKVGATSTDFRTMNGSNVNNYISFSPGTDWHHYVGVYVGGSFSKIYIDGVLKQTLSTGIPATLASTSGDIFKIGYGQTYSVAKIDEVALWNRALSDGDVADGATATSEIAALYGGTSPNIYPSNLIASNLNPIAYYPLGEQAQNTGYLDPNNPGSDISGSEWQFPNGVLQDYVMDFDSTSPGDYIDCGNDSSLNVSTSNYSLSFWIKTTSTTNLVICEKGSNDELAIQTYTSGNIRWAGINTFETSGVNVSDNNWHHLVFVANGSSSFIYIDGGLNTTGGNKIKASSNTDSFYIGSTAGLYGFNGSLSNVQIFSSALPATGSNSVQTLYNNGSPLTLMSGFTSLTNWWKLNATSVYTPSAPNYTTALSFDGTNSTYIDLNNITSLNSVSKASYSFWFKLTSNTPSSGSNSVTLIGSSAKGASCYFYNNTFYIHNFNSKFITTTQPSLNNWHHVCCVFDSGVAVAYLDGSSAGTVTEPTLTTTASDFGNNFSVGYSTFYSDYINNGGQISNVALFNTALSASQVSTLFNFGTPETNISFDPQAWWKLDDQTAITDYSGNGNTGTNNGATDATTSVAVVPSWKIPSALTVPTVNTTSAINIGTAGTNPGPIGLNPYFDFDLSSVTTTSLWIKPPASGSAQQGTILGNNGATGGATGDQTILLAWRASSVVPYNKVIETYDYGWLGNKVVSNSFSNDFWYGNWHHILMIRNNQNVSFFVDGVAAGGGTFASSQSTTPVNVNAIGGALGNWYFQNGEISNLAIWNSDQSSNVSNIYNSGQPQSSYTVTPNHLFKLDNLTTGINDVYSSSAGTATSGVTKVDTNVYVGNIPVNGVSTTLPSTALQQSDLQFDSPFSNYSLSFDGLSNLNLGNVQNNNSLTFSTWINTTSTNASIWQTIATNQSAGAGYRFQYLFSNGNSVILHDLQHGGGSSSAGQTVVSGFNDGNWHHFAFTYDGTSNINAIRMYVDTVEVYTNNSTLSGSGIAASTSNLYLSGGPTSAFLVAKFDECSIFNYSLTSAQVLEIYNNGRPKDLTTFSGTAPTNWWRLGENAYFDNNSLVVPNSISGANNGTGYGTTTSMISADAPGTYANGIGTNLDILDRVGDAALSTSNSQSYNMIPSDISPYVPQYVGKQIANNFSMSFSGVLDYISLGNPNNLQITGAISLSFWFNSTASTSGFITKSDNGSYFSSNSSKVYEIGILSNQLYWQIGDGTNVSSLPLAFSSYLDGNWHHVVATWDGTTNASSQMLFVDGLQVGSRQSTISAIQNKSNNVIISSQSSSYDYVGKLDEVAIFDTALNAGQIYNDIYQPTSTGTNQTADLEKNPNLPTPVAWYRMGD